MQRNFIFSPGEYYHIYNRGVEKRRIFFDEGDHDRFIKLLYLANSYNSFSFGDLFKRNPDRNLEEIDIGKNIVAIGAWCIMPNHFHLLVKCFEDSPQDRSDPVGIFMKKFLTGYSMYFNRKYQHKGTLFEGTYKAKHLDTDEYLKYQYAYIHLNPIGIIDKGWKDKKIKDKKKAKKFLGNYKYSSYKDYSGEEREEGLILNKKEFPEYFEKFTDFNDMINEWINFTS